MTARPRKPIWIRWYPKDALDGMAQLSPMEELAYRRILDLIVTTGDALRDDDRALAWMTKAGRQWGAVKARLIELEKIEVAGGFVRNARATAACVETETYVAQKIGAANARHGTLNQLKNNRSDRADAYPPGPSDASPSQMLVNNHDSSLRSESSPAHAPAVRKRADEPLPRVDLPDWLPADAWAAWCAYRLKRNRKAWTQHAAELGIRELAKLRADGNDPREVIEQSIASGWTGLFALKGGRSIPLFNGGPHERNDRPAERRTYGAGGSDASRRGVLDAFPELAAGLEGD